MTAGRRVAWGPAVVNGARVLSPIEVLRAECATLTVRLAAAERARDVALARAEDTESSLRSVRSSRDQAERDVEALRARVAEFAAAPKSSATKAPAKARKVDGFTFAAAVRLVKPIVETRPTLPILGTVRISSADGRAVVEATDRTTFVRLATSDEYTGPALAVDPRLLAKAKGALRAGDRSTLDVGGAGLPALDGADYPDAPALDLPMSTVHIPADALAAALRRMVHAIAPDDYRYGLNGALVETNAHDRTTRFVATDGNRLAYATLAGVEWALPRKFLLPRKTAELLATILAKLGSEPVVVTTYDYAVRLACGPFVLVARLLEADFPDYRQVLPTTFKRRATLDRDELAAELKRILPFTDSGNFTVTFDFGGESVGLQARTVEKGECRGSVPCNFAWDNLRIGFNARLMLESLAAMPVGTVTLDMGDTLAPCQLVGTDAGNLDVIMPIRLD